MNHLTAAAGARRALPLLLLLALAGHAQATPADTGTPSAAAVQASQRELAQITLAIAESGAGWNPRLSPVSTLSLDQKRRLAGVPAGTRGQPPYINPRYSSTGSGTLPASLDWRNVNGHNYVSAVKNQGMCGSCWAFAVTAGLESRALIANAAPGGNLDLSEQMVLSCSGAGTCDGGWPDLANKYLVASGSPQEGFFPYSASDAACSLAKKGWQNDSFRIANWQYVVQNAKPDVDTIKNALLASGPLVTTMQVYDDFYYYGSGVYKHVSGDYVGGHAILIVGWDDAAQAFIVKNSWDTTWGENGFFRIAYSELGGDTQFANQMTLADGDSIAPKLRCDYTLSPTRSDIPAPGGSGTLDIKTGAQCAWSVPNPAAWLSWTSPTSGIGSGKVSYTVAANETAAARSLTVPLGSASWQLTQDAGATAPPTVAPVPIAPQGTHAAATATFSWRPIPAAESYFLLVRLPDGTAAVQRNDVSALSLGCARADSNSLCTLPGVALSAGKNYQWFVLGANSKGYGPWSEPVAFSTAAQP